MPGKLHSKAQMRKMFAMEARGDLPKGKAEEMARAEGPKRLAALPEYAHEKKKKRTVKGWLSGKGD